eukprot:g1863.t1
MLLSWGMLELAFFFLNLFRIRSLNRQVQSHFPTNKEIVQNFDKFLKSLSHVNNSKEHLKGWFFEKEFASIPRGNIIDLLAYGFGHQSREEVRSQHTNALFDSLLRKLEKQEGLSFEPGFDPSLQFKSHLWNDLRVFHFPCIIYIILRATSLVFACSMGCLGFHRRSVHGKRVYMRSTSKGKEKEPIVFLHGLGLGPGIYLPFIKTLCELDRSIVFLEMPQLWTRLNWKNTSVDQTVHELKKVLDHLGVDTCHIIGHSYGTFVASRFWNLYPSYVASLCLIDPVCCAMHNPKLLTNFVYSQLSYESCEKFLGSLLTWTLSHDPSISASVCRYFYWSLLNLWPEDIHDRTLLVLSDADSIVPVDDIQTIFKTSSAKILSHPSHQHAGFVLDFSWQRSIIASIKETLLLEDSV